MRLLSEKFRLNANVASSVINTTEINALSVARFLLFSKSVLVALQTEEAGATYGE